MKDFKFFRGSEVEETSFPITATTRNYSVSGSTFNPLEGQDYFLPPVKTTSISSGLWEAIKSYFHRLVKEFKEIFNPL